MTLVATKTGWAHDPANPAMDRRYVKGQAIPADPWTGRSPRTPTRKSTPSGTSNAADLDLAESGMPPPRRARV